MLPGRFATVDGRNFTLTVVITFVFKNWSLIFSENLRNSLEFPARIYICERFENIIHGEGHEDRTKGMKTIRTKGMKTGRRGLKDNPSARSDSVIFHITHCKSMNNKTHSQKQLWILKGLKHPEIHSHKFLQ